MKELVKQKLPAAMAEQDDLGGWHIWASPGRPHDLGYDEIYEELAWNDAYKNLHCQRCKRFIHPAFDPCKCVAEERG